MTIGPALPLSHAESDWVAGEGTLMPALAGMSIQWVYCACGEDVRGEEWHEHVRDGHDAAAIQRKADWVNDCILILDEQAFVNPTA